jgi:hypothetical protein
MADGGDAGGGKEEEEGVVQVQEVRDEVLGSNWLASVRRVLVRRCKRLRAIDMSHLKDVTVVTVEQCKRLDGVLLGDVDGASMTLALCGKLQMANFGTGLAELSVVACPMLGSELRTALSFGVWRNLAKLSIERVPLPPLGETAPSLPLLRSLTLQECALGDVPRSWLSGCPELRLLSLRRNSLGSFPSYLPDLCPMLESLDVSENPIESIPPSVARNGALRSLSAESCLLQSLPVDAFCKMLHLSDLRVFGNPLRDLRTDAFRATIEERAARCTDSDALQASRDPRGAIAGLFDVRKHVRHVSAGPPPVAEEELGHERSIGDE